MSFLSNKLCSRVRPASLANFKIVRHRTYTKFDEQEAEFLNPYKYLMYTNDTVISTLPNGVRVAVQRTNHPCATIGLYVKAGSAYEQLENNGLTHFFKEASMTPINSSILPIFESAGARLTARVGRQVSSFVSSGLPADSPMLIDLLGQVITKKDFSDQVVEAARKIAINQKSAFEFDYENLSYDYIHTSGYQNSSLANPIMGSLNVLRNLNSEDLRSWSDHFVAGENLLLVAVGDVDPEGILREAEKAFGSIPKQVSVQLPYRKFVETIGSEIRIRDDTMKHVYGAHAVESVGWNSTEFTTFNLLLHHYGSWDVHCGGGNCLSPELSEVVSDECLAVKFKTFNFSYEDTGLFGIYFESSYDRADEMVAAISEHYLKAINITEPEISRARINTIVSYLKQIQSPQGLADDIANHVIYTGEHITPSEFVSHMARITRTDVMYVMKRHFRDVDPILCNIGPIKYIPDYGIFRTRTTPV